jgi:hypothetical protein
MLLFSASMPDAAYARSPTTGITVSLRPESTMPPGEIVCTGGCLRGTNLDVTVWKDGRMTYDGLPARVSMGQATRFSKILLLFRPVGKDATADPSKLSQVFCPVKVQWPITRQGGRPVICGTYNSAPDTLFTAVREALRSVQINIAAPKMF